MQFFSPSANAKLPTTRVAATNNEIFFDGLGTSQGIDNPWLEQTIKLFAEQEGYRNAIHGKWPYSQKALAISPAYGAFLSSSSFLPLSPLLLIF